MFNRMIRHATVSALAAFTDDQRLATPASKSCAELNNPFRIGTSGLRRSLVSASLNPTASNVLHLGPLSRALKPSNASEPDHFSNEIRPPSAHVPTGASQPKGVLVAPRPASDWMEQIWRRGGWPSRIIGTGLRLRIPVGPIVIPYPLPHVPRHVIQA